MKLELLTGFVDTRKESVERCLPGCRESACGHGRGRVVGAIHGPRTGRRRRLRCRLINESKCWAMSFRMVRDAWKA